MAGKSRLSCVVLVAGILTAVLMALIGASAVADATEDDEPSLYWLDDREDVIYGPVLPQSIDVDVAVSGALTEHLTVTLRALNFTSSDGELVPFSYIFTDAGQQEQSKRVHTSADPIDFGLTVHPTLTNGLHSKVEPGSYTGQLVAQLGTDEPIRKELTIVVPDRHTLAGLVPESETLTVGASVSGFPLALANAWGALLDKYGIEQLERQTSVDELASLRLYGMGLDVPDLNSVTPVSVTLVSEQGLTVTTTLSPTAESASVGHLLATLRLGDLAAPGKYTGTIQLEPADPEKGSSLSITALIRDDWRWPLRILAMGLAVSNVLSMWAGHSIPSKRLQISLNRLKEEAIGLQEAGKEAADTEKQKEKEQHPDSPLSFDLGAYRIYDKGKKQTGEPSAESGLLASAAERVLEAFGEARTPEEQTKWGLSGDEFRRVRDYVAQLAGLHAVARETFRHCSRLKEQIDHHDGDEVDFYSLPVALKARRALEPRLVPKASDLEDLQRDLKEASSFVDEFRDLYLWLLELRKKAGGNQQYVEEAEKLRRQLITTQIENADWVRQIRADAERLARDIAVLGLPIKGFKGLARTTLYGQLTGAIISRASERGLRLGGLRDPGELFYLLGSVESVSERVREGRFALLLLNGLFVVVSGVVVLLTGLTALYMTNDTFGSLGDYAGMFLWGTVVDEGFKLARRFGPGLAGRLAVK